MRMLAEAHLVNMMGEIASPAARRTWLKTVRHLLQHAVPMMGKDNPAAGIAQVKLPKSKGHWTWTDDQIAQYRKHWKLGTQQRLVFEFALETVSRRGEVMRLGPQHCYSGSEGERRIRIERTHGSADVDFRFRTLWRRRSTPCRGRRAINGRHQRRAAVDGPPHRAPQATIKERHWAMTSLAGSRKPDFPIAAVHRAQKGWHAAAGGSGHGIQRQDAERS